jgi:putative membrane protein insertion efficiency factor
MLVIWFLRLYQFTISPMLPPNTCRFYPTCSQYAIDAIRKYGTLRGSWASLKRVSKCHPYHPGGYDPI